MDVVILDILACVACLLALGRIYSRQTGSHLSPPGPKGLPLLGNLLDIPRERAWLKYMEWGRQFNSDILRMNVFGNHAIVLNSFEAARDLLDKRSSIYSDRQHNTMLHELVGWDWSVTLDPYGERWREKRRLLHQNFSPEAVKQFQGVQKKACHELLKRLISCPERFMRDIRYMTGRIILSTTYGIEIEDENDPYIILVERGVAAFSATVNVGSYLVNSLPILKYIPAWFPGANFQKQASHWRPLVKDVANVPFQFVKKHMAEGDLNDCVAMSLLEGIPSSGKDTMYTEELVKAALGTIYGAASDTTTSALCTFFLAMVLYPKAQREAQEEIDRIIGSGRLPEFSDKDALPYITAILNETLRWHPVAPLNIPHRLSEDDIYRGYYIPKGSLIVANHWAMLHDESVHPNPSIFNPSRFLKDGKINPDILDPEMAAFGFGRRKCPGSPLAKETLWITMASILASFTIESVEDKDGLPIPPAEEFTEGFISYPKPFKCTIRPRSDQYKDLILATGLEV